MKTLTLKSISFAILTAFYSALLLTACGGEGDSHTPRTFSIEAVGGTESDTAAETIVLSDIPDDFTFINVDSKTVTSLNLSWDNYSSDDIDSYVLAYQEGQIAPPTCDSGTTIEIQRDPTADITSIEINDLEALTYYAFRLCAVDTNENILSRGVTYYDETSIPEIIDTRDKPNRIKNDLSEATTIYFNAPSNWPIQIYVGPKNKSCNESRASLVPVNLSTYSLGTGYIDLYAINGADLRHIASDTYGGTLEHTFRLCVKYKDRFSAGIKRKLRAWPFSYE